MQLVTGSMFSTYPSISQSVLFFLSTTPLKPLHRISHSSFHLLSEINKVSQKPVVLTKSLLVGLLVGAVDFPSWEHVVFTAHYNKHMNLRGKKRLDNWTDGSWRDLIMDFKKRL